MPDPRPAGPDLAHEIARELLNVLPFGARPAALRRCPRLARRVDEALDATPPDDGSRAAAAVVDAVESAVRPVPVPGQPEPLPAPLVRHMLHVLLATRDMGWPGVDAPLSVRRVAAADLFFDATQTVLTDDDWKGPDGVEFALLSALAGALCRRTVRRSAVCPDEERAPDVGAEMLGHLHRVRRPRGL
jgi:hypothetical protein